ncbi:MAG: polymer-forming cytoskeletal protein [Anaerovibrio sp.]|uniref:bactofilin family protein n=1 Tax=Anaerovibrio sp. TaxID=1872532 RepID=UPI0025F40AB2|nr:polymer-forming cytoskeletal protein [Anaerovibrio sp.]MCR5177129.1 polymer-forming cytoskeletal protein [Anaerovibrio sp.]
MFGSVKKQFDNAHNNDIETIIGNNTVIKGEISGSSNLRIDGNVEGSISISGCVVIGPSGDVHGDINADDLVVSGRVEGNATIENCLSVQSTGQLIGDVKVGSLKIDDGGIFKGRSEMTLKSNLVPSEAL